VVVALRSRGWTLAVAESLTGGLLGAAVTDVPGSSSVFRGGVTVYATDLKSTLLGVDAQLLTRVGPVAAETALAMAIGVRDRLGADCALATTGVAGPGSQGTHPAGEVHLAVAWPAGTRTLELRLRGDRDTVRQRTVDQALLLLLDAVAAGTDGRSPGDAGEEPGIGASAR